MNPRLVAVVAVLALLVGVGEATRREPPPGPAATAVPLLGAAVVCPDVDSAAVVAGASGTGPGTLRARTLGQPYGVLPVREAGRVAVVDRAAGTAVVAGTGSVAGGLGVELRTRDLDGPMRGLSAMRCGPAGTSSWSVGGATVAGDSAQLVLANADDSPALVDVTSWSASGPVERRPGRGIAVPARGRVVVELDELAPDRELLALHVEATRGRVAAAVRHSRADGRTPRGTDWVPLSPPPATEVLVPGLPAGPGRRTVVVTNPGSDETTVELDLLTDDGQVDLEPVVVPAGTSVAREVSEELEQTPAAVRVRSTGGPVLAAGFVYDLQEGSVRELSWAGAAEPLRGPALLADVALSPPAEVTLLVSAPGEDAVVDLVPLEVVGQDLAPPPPRRLVVPGGTTLALRLSELLPPGTTARLALELRPSGGPVVASRYVRERAGSGPLTAVLPVVAATGDVLQPAVRPDPLSGR